jgi:ribose 5-phosphate isomerase B
MPFSGAIGASSPLISWFESRSEPVTSCRRGAGICLGVSQTSGRLRGVRVYLASDHAGFHLKEFLLRHLAGLGHDTIDIGASEYDAEDDYPPFCIEAARRVLADSGSLGVVIGGSGNGEQIAANKVDGCRAALGWSVETARLARAHNDAQVIALGGRMHTEQQAAEIVEAFLDTPFSGDPRHQRRIEQLAEYERTGIPPAIPPHLAVGRTG